ncbi:MAG: hypothetical protein KC733_08610, partial [Candidatus Omnitrophica bacterium]|nr:hypothetical protein [Candidatus Omnitrophota bacterium]
MGTFNPKSVEKTLKVKTQNFITYNLPKFEKLKIGHPQKLPFSIKILLESALRNYDDYQITMNDIETLA